MASVTAKHDMRPIVPAEQEIRFWMRAPAITINLAAPLSDALALMREHDMAMLMIENKIGGLPVVDENFMIVGIITESDLFEALVQQLDHALGA